MKNSSPVGKISASESAASPIITLGPKSLPQQVLWQTSGLTLVWTWLWVAQD